MLAKVAVLAACLSLAAAVPAPVRPLLPRQTQAYPDNGTLVNPPNVTEYTRPNPLYTTEQYNQVKLAYSAIERLTILKSFGSTDDYFKFDFTPNGSHSNAANGLGGQAYLADVTTFPVLMGTGLSVAIGYLNPCGLDSIHLHNRASEMVLLVSGVSLKTGFVLEDGFGKHSFSKLGHHTSIDIPQTCRSTRQSACTKELSARKAHSIGSSTTIASLPSSLHRFRTRILVFLALRRTSSSVSLSMGRMVYWHGTFADLTNFLRLDPQEIVDADLAYPPWLDNVNTTDYRALLPAAFAQGAKECYTRCGLTYDTNDAGGISK